MKSANTKSVLKPLFINAIIVSLVISQKLNLITNDYASLLNKITVSWKLTQKLLYLTPM